MVFLAACSLARAQMSKRVVDALRLPCWYAVYEGSLFSDERRGAIPPFVVGDAVDVEVGEWAAAHSKVVFYPDMVEQTTTTGSHDTTWLVNFTTPLHVRYHRPRSQSSHGNAEALVRLPHPGVLLQCTSLELPESCLTITVPLPCAAHDAITKSFDNDVQFLHGDEDELYEVFEESNECYRSGKNCLGSKNSKTSVPKLADDPLNSRKGLKISNPDISKKKRVLEAKLVPEVLRDNFPLPAFGVPFADGYPSGFSELPTCYWLPLHTFSTSEGLSFSVPVGDLDHLELVLFITTAVTTAATLLLLTPVLRQYRQQFQLN
ncbi:Glycosylphosphatidylinositol-mannosyltransferase I PIG-X/PBN1 [Trinorchestia longiramus]|nr:Glycosylphosphatidylinositol-mannosyltransferase I PIG-X/PBN1 [Trinorchestia longiramus]